MLNEILTISGKPSLYKLLTRGRGALIVENIDETKKRLPIQGTDKVVPLGDISIFTDDDIVGVQGVSGNGFAACEQRKQRHQESNQDRGDFLHNPELHFDTA